MDLLSLLNGLKTPLYNPRSVLSGLNQVGHTLNQYNPFNPQDALAPSKPPKRVLPKRSTYHQGGFFTEEDIQPQLDSYVAPNQWRLKLPVPQLDMNPTPNTGMIPIPMAHPKPKKKVTTLI